MRFISYLTTTTREEHFIAWVWGTGDWVARTVPGPRSPIPYRCINLHATSPTIFSDRAESLSIVSFTV